MKVRLKEDPKEWRKSTWLTVLGLALVSSLLRWRQVFLNTTWQVILGVLALIAVLAWVQPRWFRAWYRFSTRAGFWLSQVFARVFLSIVFVVMIIPAGILLRLLGKDPLRLKRRSDTVTYWTDARESSPLDRSF